MKLAELRSAEADFRDATRVALLPLGAIEQHSRHLPLGTDALLVQEVAERVEAARPDVIVLLPTIHVGASDHHLTMPGTLSVGSAAISDAAARQCLSLARSSGIRTVLLLNGHGGNQPAVRLAIEAIHASDPAIRAYGADYWAPMFAALASVESTLPQRMGHADHIETSMLLAVRPDLVRMELAVADAYRDPLPDAVFTSSGIPERTSHGGDGDPTGASARDGDLYFSASVAGVVALVDRISAGDMVLTDQPSR